MEFKIAKTQDGSMPPAFRIEFYSPRLGNRQSAYVMAQTKNEAINKFFKEKPQYKGKIKIKSVTMLNARELPKQKALKVGDSEKTQDKSPLSFMDSVVRAFRDEAPKVTLQMIKRLIGSNRNQMGGAETDSIAVGDWEISGNKEKHFSKWNYYYEAQNTKTGAYKRSGDASEILQFIKSRS